MARSIRFIAPVESLSGNMSGAQELLYPTNDNSAFESPEDAVNYARNYKPRYIGTYRRSDGSVSFQVKTKTAVHMTPAMVNAMAVMGGCGAIVAAILVSPTVKAACTTQMEIENELGYSWKTLREFLTAKIRPALESKAAQVVIAPVGGIINNPWVEGGTGVDLQISNQTIVKFWDNLATLPYKFKVSSLTAVSHTDETFGDLVSSHHNVLGLFKVPQGDDINCIKLENQFVVEQAEVEGEIVEYQVMADTSTTVANKYYLSDTKGEARG